MNIDYEKLSPSAKVWIYTADRILTKEEGTLLEEKFQQFLSDWKAHENDLSAFGKIYYNRFLVLLVDETFCTTSGCSIDASVHFIKEAEKKFSLSFFNRMLIAYQQNDEIKVVDKNVFEKLLNTKEINEATIVFNNLVQTKKEWETQWQIPLAQSWHKQLLTAL